MKRTILLLLAALLMWQCVPALTEIIVPAKITEYTGLPDIPDTKNFAALTTKQAEDFIYITQQYHRLRARITFYQLAVICASPERFRAGCSRAYTFIRCTGFSHRFCPDPFVP